MGMTRFLRYLLFIGLLFSIGLAGALTRRNASRPDRHRTDAPTPPPELHRLLAFGANIRRR